MIDFHAHILPSADHGSDSIETSLFQVNSAKNIGIDTIVATPHFYINNDDIDSFLVRREKAFQSLMNAINEINIDIKIIKAAEVTLMVDLLSVDDLTPLCIENTNYVLLEMPMNVVWTSWHYEAVDEIIKRGIKPIIAHINRYQYFYVKKLFDKDVLFQTNVEAFDNFLTRRNNIKLYKSGHVDLIGSDIHERSNAYSKWLKYQNKYFEMFDHFNENANIILNKKTPF